MWKRDENFYAFDRQLIFAEQIFLRRCDYCALLICICSNRNYLEILTTFLSSNYLISCSITRQTFPEKKNSYWRCGNLFFAHASDYSVIYANSRKIAQYKDYYTKIWIYLSVSELSSDNLFIKHQILSIKTTNAISIVFDQLNRQMDFNCFIDLTRNVSPQKHN